MGRVDGPQQLPAHQGEQIPLPHGQILKVCLFQFQGGQDGVVIRYPAVIHQRRCVREEVGAGIKGRHLSRQVNQDRCRLRHVSGQIPAVCPGIGEQPFLIEALGVVQRLLGGVAQCPVGLPLEGGQVIEGGGLLRFLPPLRRLDHGGAALAPGGGLLGLLLAGRPLP